MKNRIEQTTNDYIFLRHGRTDLNEQKRFSGSTDVPLNEGGKSEARLVKLPSDIHLAFVSPLLRARQTLEHVPEGSKLPMFIEPRLTEKDGGLAEGLPFSTIATMFPEAWESWSSGNIQTILDARFPGGESEREVIQRVHSFLQFAEQMYQNMTILVVAHAGVFRAFQFALSTPWQEIYTQKSVGNSSITSFPSPQTLHQGV